MVRNYKRKTVDKYPKEKLREAIEAVRQNQMNSYRAAAMFNVPRSTIITHLYRKRRTKLKDNAEINTSSGEIKLEQDPLDNGGEPDLEPLDDNAHSFYEASNIDNSVLSSQPSPINLIEELHSCVSQLVDTTNRSKHIDEDEFDTFGRHVANHLRNLPTTNAILCQNYINNYLTEERLKARRGHDNSTTNVASTLNSEMSRVGT